MTTDPAASHVEGSPFRRLLLERTPRVIVTPALIVANVLIYAATAGASGQADPRPDVLVGWGALFGPGVANGEWWRLVSAMFLHAGILHIALNCLFLRQIGNMVERLLGSFSFLTIYLLTGVTGAIASLMAHPRSIGVGASGALFGITGALLAVVLSSGGQMRELLDDRPISVGLGRPDAEITPRPSRALGEGMLIAMRGLRVGLFMFLVYNVAFAFVAPGIDVAAHAGGFAGGLVFGWLVARDAITRRPPLMRLALPVLVTVALAALQVERMHAHADVLAESLAFDATETRHLAQFDAARNAVASGRTRPDEAAVLVERSVFPDVLATRNRCEALRRAAHDNLTRAATLDQYGRARDWQHLEQFRGEVAQAEAWAAFLNARQESWQLRVRSLRENEPALADQAKQLDQAATIALMEAMRSATP
jgi:rhomboid protease GluP